MNAYQPLQPLAARCCRRGCAWLLLATVLLWGTSWGAPRAAAQSQESRDWALLVGIEAYERATPLMFTVNDVVQLARTLVDRGGFLPGNVLQMTDQSAEANHRPTKENLLREIARFLARPRAGDRVMVYFTGHGFRDQDERMYLAPIDCDPANPAATGIPVEWLREQLAGCKADFKLLVLDSCHAGSEKGDDQPTVVAKDLGEPFRDLTGVITLASSTGDEKSQLWQEKQQSLFSYWLNEGLKGHADENGDSQIDIDELNKYVHRNVTHTAQRRFSRQQTPVRIVRSGTPGVPVVIALRPLSLKEVINDMADQLAWAMEERGLNKVGVLEFTNDTRLGELLGADFGTLGRYCAHELQARLMRLGGERFSVVDQRRLQSALSGQRMTIDQLGSPDALRRLSAGAGGMPVIALGTLRNRTGRLLQLQCQLLQTEDDGLAGTAAGTAYLNESEWAMLGRSVIVDVNDHLPTLGPVPGGAGSDVVQQAIERWDERSRGPHPMQDPQFPFRVEIRMGGKLREPVFKGNDMLVPVRKGETFQVWIENRSGQKAMLRLLVDGLNTLPQKAPDLEKGIDTMLVAPRVNLDEARPWVLDPEQATRYAISGFVAETGAQGKTLEFKVVDISESFAARQQFTEQVGLITAAFYSASTSRGPSIAIGQGQELTQDLTERSGFKVGSLLGVVNIRYVDANSPELRQ